MENQGFNIFKLAPATVGTRKESELNCVNINTNFLLTSERRKVFVMSPRVNIYGRERGLLPVYVPLKLFLNMKLNRKCHVMSV